MKTIGSLFAGIGGFDLGFERAGFKTSWAVEIDQKAQAVLRLRFPDAELHDDVTHVGADCLGPVDVVTFGSPCQDLSVAGKRAGLAGGRSGLFHESARIIRELQAKYGKPDFAVWENVPGAFSSNGGRDFAVVVQEMVDLGARDVAWRVLDSRFFGVAQRRRRVFLVADFGGKRASEVLALAEGVRGYSPKGRKARQGVAEGAGEGAGGGGPYWDGGDLSDTLDVAGLVKGQAMPERRRFPAVLLPELSGMLGGGSGQRGWSNDLDRSGAFIPQGPVVRRLTPVECCRLQGFPDDWNAEGIDKSGKRIVMADSSRYKQLGNAVTVNVAEWLAKRINAAT